MHEWTILIHRALWVIGLFLPHLFYRILIWSRRCDCKLGKICKESSSFSDAQSWGHLPEFWSQGLSLPFLISFCFLFHFFSLFPNYWHWEIKQIKVEKKVGSGDAKDIICTAAKQLMADMLVMGSHDYGFFKR